MMLAFFTQELTVIFAQNLKFLNQKIKFLEVLGKKMKFSNKIDFLIKTSIFLQKK